MVVEDQASLQRDGAVRECVLASAMCSDNLRPDMQECTRSPADVFECRRVHMLSADAEPIMGVLLIRYHARSLTSHLGQCSF